MPYLSKLPRLVRWVVGVMFFFLVVMMAYRFIFFYHFQPEGRPFSGTAFWLGFRYDLKFMAMMGLGIFIPSVFPFLNPFKSKIASRFWKIIVPAAFLVLLVFLIADFYHYDYLHQKLNATVLNFLADAGISFSMMQESYPLGWILLLLVAGIFLFSWWHNRYLSLLRNTPAFPGKKKRRVIIFIVFGLLLGISSFGKLGQFPLRWSDAFLLQDDFKSNTALNPLQTFFSSLKVRSNSYNLAQVEKYYPLISQWLDVKNPDSSSLNYERVYQPSDTLLQKPNIILVICESFSMYKSSMSGNPLNTTPYFNELCKQGLFFDRCFSPAFGTARGVWATVTGLPDVEEISTASRNPAAVNQHTLINAFKGYEHYYFLGGNPTWANIQGLLSNNISGLKMYSQPDFKAQKIDVWGVSDKNLLLESAGILAKETKPFFAIIQTADNHRPYTIPEEDLSQFQKKVVSDSLLEKFGFESNAEYNAFRYTDFCFEQFMTRASQMPYYKNTLFVFIGDHGIRGNARGVLPPAYTSEGLTAEHVPLLYFFPGFIPPKRIHEVCSQLDLLPTLAGILHQPYRYSGLGRNMFDSTDDRNRDPYAFIIDHDLKTIGVVSDSFYFWHNLRSGMEKLVSILDNSTGNIMNYPVKREKMKDLTLGLYETSRYLLLHNQKKN